MVKRAVSETSDYLSPKEEPSTPPPTTPKKAKKSPSTPSTNGSRGSIKESPGNGMPGSLAKTARGRYMELIFEAGLKAVNKKAVQDETGLSPAQQSEMVRKDKGPLRRALGGFVGSL